LKLITWNINSVRIRLDQLNEVIDELEPDVICLQETKCEDNKFPLKEIQELGFKYVAINGQPSYNGVAILSRKKFDNIVKHDFCYKSDSRHISAEFSIKSLDKKLTIHNFYVPAGGDEPDPEINPKFEHKLQFLDEMSYYIRDVLRDNNHHIFVGDMNIAPHVHDVWSHNQLLNVVSHTEIERKKLIKIINNNSLCDIMRHFVHEEEKVYSWWSYRNRDWRKSNRGRRLDHIWLSNGLVKNYINHTIFFDARDFERPSDHVPIIVQF
jgi:exodeoxyribonuclease-3